MMAGPGLRGGVGVPPSLAYRRRHVLEFKPIYTEKAKKRQIEGQGKGRNVRYKKAGSGPPGAGTRELGRTRDFMARDASVGRCRRQ